MDGQHAYIIWHVIYLVIWWHLPYEVFLDVKLVSSASVLLLLR
jgi:hypothetical protein